MTIMCHVCGSDRGTLNGVHCRICQSPFCQACEKRDSSSAAFGGDHIGKFCGSCLEKLARDSFSGNISSYHASTLTSPALSLSSYGSCTSSCGDLTSYSHPAYYVLYHLLRRIFLYCILQVFHFNFMLSGDFQVDISSKPRYFIVTAGNICIQSHACFIFIV